MLDFITLLALRDEYLATLSTSDASKCEAYGTEFDVYHGTVDNFIEFVRIKTGVLKQADLRKMFTHSFAGVLIDVASDREVLPIPSPTIAIGDWWYSTKEIELVWDGAKGHALPLSPAGR